MICSQVAAKLEQKNTEMSPAEIARMVTLLLSTVDDCKTLTCDTNFESHWQDVTLRIQAANDQHEAMTLELEELAKSDPKQFTPDQIWVLIRAIKVQSQMLKMYVGEPLFEVH